MKLSPSRILTIALILAMALALANCGRMSFGVANVPAYFGPHERRADIPYGSEPRQSLDVYVPTPVTTARTIIVFWYGGMWVKGSKDQYRFVGAALANAGYVAVLPDYRLYPSARFPHFIEDGALAVRWAHDHAAEIGGDPNSIFLMGHSAGAHLAASLALSPSYLQQVGGNSEWIRGWIGLSGPYDLDTRYPPVLHEIFREPYAATDWQPIALANPHAPPALLLHGGRDGMVPPLQADLLSQALSGLGVAVDCRIYAEAGHLDTVAAFSLPLRYEAPSLADVKDFIVRTSAGNAPRVPCAR